VNRIFDFTAVLTTICFFGQVGLLESGALPLGQALIRMVLCAAATVALVWLGGRKIKKAA